MFAEILKNDTSIQAAGGVFNAIGYSQGNLIIRGYVERYSGRDGYPTAHHHMSMFGMGMGVAGFPNCDVQTYQVCRELASLLGSLAYYPAVQDHLMQANYYRDPMHIPEFQAGDQVASVRLPIRVAFT